MREKEEQQQVQTGPRRPNCLYIRFDSAGHPHIIPEDEAVEQDTVYIAKPAIAIGLIHLHEQLGQAANRADANGLTRKLTRTKQDTVKSVIQTLANYGKLKKDESK